MTRRIALLTLALACAACTFNVGGMDRTAPLEEKELMGSRGPKILLLSIEGTITEESDRNFLTGERDPGMVARVREALDLAEGDDDVAAVLLRIRSPGGTVTASDTLHHEISRWKKRTGRPVHAYLDGMATSGGYYVAMASDEITAHPTTVTGSIGVIMLNMDMTGLMAKIGVEDRTFTSGPHKDSGSWFRPMRDEEREQIQGIVDDMHARFRKVVAEGRPALAGTEGALDRVTDGRIFSATQAKSEQLIDSVGFLDDAVERLRRQLGAEEVRLISYRRDGAYHANYYAARPTQIDVSLVSLPERRLPSGFYYLWRPALGMR